MKSLDRQRAEDARQEQAMPEQLRDMTRKDRDANWKRATQESIRTIQKAHESDGMDPDKAYRKAAHIQEAITNRARDEHGS